MWYAWCLRLESPVVELKYVFPRLKLKKIFHQRHWLLAWRVTAFSEYNFRPIVFCGRYEGTAWWLPNHWRQILKCQTHRMQISSCSLLETSAVSSAMIVKKRSILNVCKYLPPLPLQAHSEYLVMCISQALFRSHSMISGFSWARSFSSWWKLEFFSEIVSVFQSPPLNGKACRAKYRMLERIASKIFLFLLFFRACRSDRKSPISLITVFEILRLVWTIWYVYKDLIWRAELWLCRFHFASYCCRWLQIIFSSGLFFDSDCFFDYTRLCVTCAWFTHDKSVPFLFSTPQVRSQQVRSLPVNDISGMLYLVDPMWVWEELQF